MSWCTGRLITSDHEHATIMRLHGIGLRVRVPSHIVELIAYVSTFHKTGGAESLLICELMLIGIEEQSSTMADPS